MRVFINALVEADAKRISMHPQVYYFSLFSPRVYSCVWANTVTLCVINSQYKVDAWHRLDYILSIMHGYDSVSGAL